MCEMVHKYIVQLVAVARKLELVPSIFTSNESSTKEHKKKINIVYRFFVFRIIIAIYSCLELLAWHSNIFSYWGFLLVCSFRCTFSCFPFCFIFFRPMKPISVLLFNCSLYTVYRLLVIGYRLSVYRFVGLTDCS